MERILILGVSAGVGKSTFARQLGERLQLEVCHLDRLFWLPGWVQAPMEDFAQRQLDFMNEHQRWIIEGNYTGTYEPRRDQADTIIYLELPLLVCYFRVIKRRIRSHGKTRPDMAPGCPEKLDWAFTKFIWTTYRRRKSRMRERLREFEKRHPNNKVVLLKGQRAIAKYLESIHPTN